MARRQIKVELTAQDQLTAKLESIKKLMEALGLAEIGAKAMEGARAIEELVARQIELGAATDRLAEKTGISTEKLGGLEHAARLTDVSTQSLEKGLKKLASSAVEAAGGNAAANNQFKALGISVTDAHGKLLPLDSVLGKVADRFAATKDGPEKAAMAVKLFGRAGMDMIPILNQGSAGIAQLTEEAKRMGKTLSADEAESFEHFQQTVIRLQEKVEGLATTFAKALIPELENTFDVLEGQGPNALSSMEEAGKGVVKVLNEVLMWLYRIASGFSEAFAMEERYEQGVYKLMPDFLKSEREKADEKKLPDAIAKDHNRAESFDKKADDLDFLIENGVPRMVKRRFNGPKTARDGEPSMGIPEHEDKGRLAAALAAEREAQEKSSQAIAAAKLKIAADTAKNEELIAAAKNDALYAEEGESLQQYLMRRAQLLDDASKKEIALAKEAAAEHQDSTDVAEAIQMKLAQGTKDPVQRAGAETKLATMRGEAATKQAELEQKVADLQAKRITDGIKNATDLANADKVRYEYDLAKEAALQEAQDHRGESALAAIDAQYRAAVETRHKTDGPNASTADLGDARDRSKASVMAGVSQSDIDELVASYNLYARTLGNEVAQRQMTADEMEQKLNIRRGEAANQMRALVAQYHAYAEASGDPKLKAHAAELDQQVKELGQAQNAAKMQLANSLDGSFENLFASMASGATSAAQAFKSFAMSVVADIDRMIAKALIMKYISPLINSALGLGGGAASAGVSAGSSTGPEYYPGHAGGGMIEAGRATWVGERGPELIVPHSQGYVVNNDIAKNLSGGGQQQPAQVNIHTSTSQPVTAKSQARWTPQGMVTDILIHDHQSNGPIRQMYGASFGGK